MKTNIKNKTNGKRSNKTNATRQTQMPSTQVVRFSPSVFGFPDRLVSKVRYADILSIGCTAGALNTQKFRWNSTFDPDYTNGGHQPMYRDTYASIYDHYAVISSKLTVKIINGNSSVPFVCGLVTDDDSTNLSTYYGLMEQNHGSSDFVTSLSGSQSCATLSSQWSAKEVLGIDPFTSEEYKTAIGSNPTEESYAVVWAIPFDGISTGSVGLHVILEQEVLWTELTTPVTS